MMKDESQDYIAQCFMQTLSQIIIFLNSVILTIKFKQVLQMALLLPQ